MLNKYIDFLISCSRKSRSRGYKILAVGCGATIFVLIIPAVFIFSGKAIEQFVPIPVPFAVRVVVAGVFICVGLHFSIWSVYTQWAIGKGTPLPLAPTQILIVSGPYKYCRNPMKLGMCLYYFGITTYFSGVVSGLAALIVAFTLGSLYHKSAEEKELLLRFGAAYSEYKSKTPFVFPRIWRFK
jgi:protein-S-isoprenylcysteine O-methyltransferase Ste14